MEREGADSVLGASRATLRVPSFIDDVISAMRQMGEPRFLHSFAQSILTLFARYVGGRHLPKEWEYSPAERTDRANRP